MRTRRIRATGYYLWNLLRNGGYNVDFVGSTTDPTFTAFVFDQDHDGYSGHTTARLASDMDRILAISAPDIVLLDIGTNDVLQQVPMNDRMRNIDRIVSKLRQKNPNVRILIAQISPTADTFRNANSGLVEYNEKVLAYAQGATTPASPIVVVDMNAGWSTAQFTQADGIHPNNQGESQLAQRWTNALVATGVITLSVPTQPTVTVVPTTVPTTSPDHTDSRPDDGPDQYPDSRHDGGRHDDVDREPEPRDDSHHGADIEGEALRRRQPGLVPRQHLRRQRDRDRHRPFGRGGHDRAKAEARERRHRHHPADEQVRALVPGCALGDRAPLRDSSTSISLSYGDRLLAACVRTLHPSLRP